MLDDLSTNRKVIVSVIGFLVILVLAGAIIGSVNESGGERGQGQGSFDFKIGLAYVLGVSIVAFVSLAYTDFDKRIMVFFLVLTFVVFFFIKGGHLITLVTKLVGSEGVRATAGEVGWGHFTRFSFPLAVAGLISTLGLTFFTGRSLCAYGCPVGVFQELLYRVREYHKKARKILLPTKLTFGVRLAILGVTVGLILAFAFDLVQIVAPYQLWRLEIVIPGILIMVGFFVASLFSYRPFCRIFCPFGAIASLVAKFSIWSMSKDETCNDCGLCEKECPIEDCEKYGECYLCGRCVQICNRDSISIS
ncbi:hypothetical protein AKJ51_03840 [candidate division MSBL1 archaeon SCGC-AAA382A20]|uniref:4Fe-4S ferredoxin-type domain-containing protein n=1 Tax=candidate division MSBL1 archaeon SCGC-AAA382A20 TaxID=1698280 RepID=A0A133VIW3_9EURY|nr:hypothetical protein AKJ51_03840 [candidate division MSBL1 archaeon SCGC-AAA382A20]